MRGILIGAVLACLLNVFDAYATNIIRGSYLTLNFSTPAALFFFFFVVIAAGLTGLVHRAFALTRSELITVYFMLVVACCIPGMGFTQFMIPASSVPPTTPRRKTTGTSSTTSTSRNG